MSGALRLVKGAAGQADRLVQFGGRVADDAVQEGVNTVLLNPNDAIDSGTSLGQTALRSGAGLGAVGGGVFTADQYFDQQRLEEEANTEEEQRDLLNQIRNDPNISDEVKEQAIQTAIDNGVFDQLGVDSSGDGEDSILQNRWFQIFAAILIAIIVYRRA